MKKRFVLLSLILAFVLMLTMFAKNVDVTPKQVVAQGYDGQRIIVVGKGDVEVDPDTVQISFALKLRNASLSDGQAKMRDAIDNISSKLKSIDEDASIYTNYSAYYPVFDNNSIIYQFDCGLILKSEKIDEQVTIVDTLLEEGASSVGSIGYVLSNREDAYLQALVKAKDNAEKKANAIYKNATLTAMKEEPTFNFYEVNKGEKIKITARVNACYLVENAEEVDDGASATKDEKTENDIADENVNGGEDKGNSTSQKKIEAETNSSTLDTNSKVNDESNLTTQKETQNLTLENEDKDVKTNDSLTQESDTLQDNNADQLNTINDVETSTQDVDNASSEGLDKVSKDNITPTENLEDTTSTNSNTDNEVGQEQKVEENTNEGNLTTQTFDNKAEKEPVSQDSSSKQDTESNSNLKNSNVSASAGKNKKATRKYALDNKSGNKKQTKN